MDSFLIVLATAVGLLLIATPVIAISALMRARELRQRVDALEARLARLRSARPSPEVEPLREAEEAPEAIHSAARKHVPPPIPSHLTRPAQRTAAQSPPPREPQPQHAPRDEPQDDPGAGTETPQTSDLPAPARPIVRRVAIDWEMWLGVRGAAIVGGISLVLAGLFFFQYAIAHGYFGPGLRILVGTVAGMACMLAKGPLARRDLHVLSDVLAGAGAVILYGAAWASFQLYGFVPMPVAFAWMVAVTALTGILSVRHDSQLIAMFGLVGGFATPLLLSTGSNRPISLFGYVLLLDVALLALARRRGWPLLGIFGILGTTLLQGLWVVARMEADQAQLGLGILGVFAVLFAIGASGTGASGERDKRTWFAGQVSGLLVPFLFGLYFAARVDIGPTLTPLALLLGLLAAAACWMSRAQGQVHLALGSSVAAIGVCLAWTVNHLEDAPVLWSLTGAAIGITLVYVGFHFLPGVRGGDTTGRSWFERSEAPAAASILGFLAVLFVAASSGELELALAPLATACAVLGLLAFALDLAGLLRFLPLLVGLGMGSVMAAFAAQKSDSSFFDEMGPVPFGATLSLLALGFLALGTWRRGTDLGRRVCAAVVPLVVPSMLALEPWPQPAPVWHLWLVLAFAALGAIGAARAKSGIAYAVLALASVAAMTRWNIELYPGGKRVDSLPAALGVQAAILALLTWLPTLGRRLLPLDGWVLRAALFTTVAWAVPLNWLEIDNALEGDVRWMLFAALAGIAGVGVALLRWHESETDSAEPGVVLGARVLSVAVAAMFASFSLASFTGIEWIPVGLALCGLAWLCTGRIWEHKKLSVAGSLAVTAAAASLGLLAFVPGHFDRSEALVFNAMAVAYLVPAACALAGLMVNTGALGGRKLRAVVGASTVLLVFAWLNLGVLNFYETGSTIRFDWERVQDRDLTQSLVWGAFALVLLGIGTARRIDGLRWMSLAFQVVTIGKVFLYDLGELTGLYRAGSMMGLAVCLLLVSLLYQRFVFRKSNATSGT